MACVRACVVIFFRSFLFSCFFSDVFSSDIWSSFTELSDPSLKELSTRLKSTVLASKENGTTDAYRLNPNLNISKTEQLRKGNLLTLIIMFLWPLLRLAYVIPSSQSISQ